MQQKVTAWADIVTRVLYFAAFCAGTFHGLFSVGSVLGARCILEKIRGHVVMLSTDRAEGFLYSFMLLQISRCCTSESSGYWRTYETESYICDAARVLSDMVPLLLKPTGWLYSMYWNGRAIRDWDMFTCRENYPELHTGIWSNSLYMLL